MDTPTNRMGAFPLAGSSGPVPTLPSFGPGGGNGARLTESFLFDPWEPGQAVRREVIELIGGGGTKNHSPDREDPLVGQSERRVSGPSDGSVFVRQGSRHGSTEERSTACSPVDPVQ